MKYLKCQGVLAEYGLLFKHFNIPCFIENQGSIFRHPFSVSLGRFQGLLQNLHRSVVVQLTVPAFPWSYG
jgi:hypothetical protein